MERVPSEELSRRLRWSRVAAAAAFTIGFVALLGWLLGVPGLAAPLPGQAPVKPNTALCLVAASVALGLLTSSRRARREVWVVRLAAGLTLVLAGAALCEHLAGFDLGLDRLFASPRTLAWVPDARITPATAGALLLLGTALLRLSLPRSAPIDWLALPLLALCWVRLVCVAYQVTSAAGLAGIMRVPAPTALALACLGVGVLTAEPRSPLLSALEGSSAESSLLRKLLPATLLTPVAFGWVRLAGYRSGLYDEGFGVALTVTASSFALAGLTFYAARLTGRLSDERDQALQAYRDLYDRAPCGYHTLDPDGRLLRVNETQAEWLGYPMARLVGRPLAEFVAEEAREALAEALSHLRAGAEYEPVETILLRADGRRLPAQLSLAAVRQADGRLGFRGTLLDMTERVRHEQALAESEELLRGAFDQAAVGVGLAELDGRWRRVNQALCDLLDRPEEQLVGRRVDEVIHPEDRGARHEETRRLLAGEMPNYRLELRCLTGAGQTVWAVVNCAVAYDAARRPWLKVVQMQDVTARKQAEAELAQSVTELQHFAYVASHDLQEPLRKIRAFSDRLAVSAGPSLNERGREYLARIQSSAVRMAELLDALLAYSRLTSRPSTMGTVDLRQTVQEALQDLELVVQETGATVEVGPLPVVLGDAVRLREVFQNLLANALKFRSPERAPRLKVSSTTDDGGIEVTVQDNGIGFEPQYAAQIFQPFQRLHRMGEYPGTGMGLAIVDRIVQRHGGRMRATGVPGEGAAFTVRLPRPLPQAEES